MSACLCAAMLQCSGADCPECESVCVSWRGEQAAGVGALGRSLCPAAEADPAGRAPGRAGHGEAVPGGKEMPGPHSSYPPHVYRPLSGAAGHAGEGRRVQLGTETYRMHILLVCKQPVMVMSISVCP